MRDGVKLHTQVYVPKKLSGPLPVILLRTPYGIGTRADSTGHLTVQFTHTGTFPVRATLSGAIRSRTVWVHVTRSGSS